MLVIVKLYSFTVNQNTIMFEKPTLLSLLPGNKLDPFTAVQHILTQRNLYGPAFGPQS